MLIPLGKSGFIIDVPSEALAANKISTPDANNPPKEKIFLASLGASERFALGDELRVDLSTGTIQNLTKGNTVQGIPIPAFLLEMMQAGGLVAFLKQQLAGERPCGAQGDAHGKG